MPFAAGAIGQPPLNAGGTAFQLNIQTQGRLVPVGDGQSLIARCPDIRVAERQLARDTERVGVAVAALYPSIRPLGAPSLGAVNVGDLGSAASFGFSVGPLIS